MQMRSGLINGMVLILFVLFALSLSSISELAAMPGSVDYDSLEKKVAALQLGFGEYHVANKLSDMQKTKGQKTLQEKSYPGTYTFMDGDLYILVEKDRDLILAIYKKNEEAGKKDMKEMVAYLMSRFENPTSEAHDQIIYWAYGEDGKISDSEYKELKQGGNKPILATVKFKSKLTFSEIEIEGAPQNSIHCIVSSPKLLERFYQQ